jgi:hypothetical protein
VILDANVIGMWYIQISPTSDWFGSLRKTDDDIITLEYRFRYYDEDDPGNDPFSDKDTKNWYTLTTSVPPGVAICGVRMISATITHATGNKLHEILMHDGDVERFIEELKQMPFAHIKSEPIQ